jgi:CHASE2 domain-containing sensor protein
MCRRVSLIFSLENKLQDWVARLGKPAPQDERIVFLYDDAASHTLDQLWEEDFEAAPILKRMRTRDWPRDVYAAILEKLEGAVCACGRLRLLF